MLDKNKLAEIDLSLPVNADIHLNIPIACHYDDETLLGKNGELIQILELDGSGIDISCYGKNIRDVIRQTVTETVKDPSISLYFHTIRSRKNIMPISSELQGFAKVLDDTWCAKNNFDKQLVNTIYISIIKQGVKPQLSSIMQMIRSMVFPLIKHMHYKSLNKAHASLKIVVEELHSKLKKFSSRKLGLIKNEDGYLSEPLLFYYQLLYLEQKRTPLPINNLAQYLSCGEIQFNFNDIEITTKNGKQYAAVFSIKEYTELKPEVLDKFLQLGINFVITESVVFVPSSIAKKDGNDIYNVAITSNAKYLNQYNGLDDFFNSGNNDNTDYCQHQIIVVIHSDDKKFFQEKIRLATRTLHEMGIVIVREDFAMAKLFWSRLPGNFRYLKRGRNTYINANRIAGLCNIFSNSSGNYHGSIWGGPIALLRSSSGTPFYFNFHNSKSNGNTLIIGPEKSGKTTLMRFLLTQGCKMKPRVIYLDIEGGTKNFIETLGGHYINMATCNDIKINPFGLDSFNNDINLYSEWLREAIYPSSKTVPQYQEIFKTLAEKMTGGAVIAEKVQALKAMIDILNDSAIKDEFAELLLSPQFSQLFDENNDKLELLNQNSLLALDFSEVVKNNRLFYSFFGVFLTKLSQLLNQNDRPTIIVITNFASIFNISYFQPIFKNWLSQLNKKNVILLASTSHKEKLENSKTYLELLEDFGTKLFFSNKYADKYFKRAYSLTENELHQIKSYASERRMFLFKQDEISILLSLNLKNMQDILAVLESRNE